MSARAKSPWSLVGENTERELFGWRELCNRFVRIKQLAILSGFAHSGLSDRKTALITSASAISPL